jgi:hypothetical protein
MLNCKDKLLRMRYLKCCDPDTRLVYYLPLMPSRVTNYCTRECMWSRQKRVNVSTRRGSFPQHSMLEAVTTVVSGQPYSHPSMNSVLFRLDSKKDQSKDLTHSVQVICTTRNADALFRSGKVIEVKVMPTVMSTLFWPVPAFRYLTAFLEGLEMNMRSCYHVNPESRCIISY